MFDTSDIELTRLPKGGDGHIRALADVCRKAPGACRMGNVSSCAVLIAGRQGFWHDDSGICEYQPQASNHFQMPVRQVIGGRFVCAPMHAV